MLEETIITCGICSPEEMKIPVMNVPELCLHFGIAKGTGYERAGEGTLPVPVIRIGKRMVFSRTAVHRVLGLE